MYLVSSRVYIKHAQKPWFRRVSTHSLDHLGGVKYLRSLVSHLSTFVRWLSCGANHLPSGKSLHSYGKSQFFMDKSTISLAMFNSYVELPEGMDYGTGELCGGAATDGCGEPGDGMSANRQATPWQFLGAIGGL